MPLTRRGLVLFCLFIALAGAFLYLVLPRVAGVGQALHSLQGGDASWIAAALLFEVASYAGYVFLFRTVFARESPRVDLAASYRITMASLVATRLFATAGAGGVALTAWSLRCAGVGRRIVASRLLTFLVLLYFVFAAALLACGVALATGVVPGGGPFMLTVVPALAAAGLFALTIAAALVPGDLERRLAHRSAGDGRVARWTAHAVAVPGLAAAGVHQALALARRREVGLLGAPAWWGFDIAVLWAMFHAFGAAAPPVAVLVMAYFVGLLGNLLPLPGGLGGVEGGMIAALAAFGVELNIALVAVLGYRAISFWLPTIPGLFAYFALRRTVARWRAEQGMEPTGRFRRPAPCYALQSEAGPVGARSVPETPPVRSAA
ncbi:MAG TPA: flippase-like domain-containing protein [Solirubrobacteraceae bacterium]|nr:flippase-like domain-containing protein [Solirubrobacteraceae bacterium]